MWNKLEDLLTIKTFNCRKQVASNYILDSFVAQDKQNY